GLTVKNPRKPGTGINMAGAQDCVVRHCRIEATYGIRASQAPGAARSYIADNTIRGDTPRRPPAMGANGDNIREGDQMTRARERHLLQSRVELPRLHLDDGRDPGHRPVVYRYL